MKGQSRKGYRQSFKGIDYIVKTVKLDSSTKIVIRSEIVNKDKKNGRIS